MKKKCLFLLLVTMLVTITAWADVEINENNFPDDAFRNWILEQDYGSDGILTSEEISGVKKIKVNGKGIEDMQGIEFFTSLTELRCENNRLSSLDLFKNLLLESLDCHKNQITALNISNNTALEDLKCYDNKLTELNLSKNINITELRCYDNMLTTLIVTGCDKLDKIHCYSNQIKGAAMDAFIASLPTASNGKIRVINNINEGNVMTIMQVATAKSKGWIPYYYDDTDLWQEYAGSEPVLLGDANSDGEVDMNDAFLITDFMLSKIENPFNVTAADANQDGEIGVPDIMFIINHNLNGKFPEEEEKNMVLHHPDGTETVIELSALPLLKFLEDKVIITSNVFNKEYSQDDILSITYKGAETNETNFEIGSGTIGEAFYIYRNDGVINGFVRSDVDSIAYSRYDAKSKMHNIIVAQIVYTNDSVFHIPLAAIDSVSFVTPKTIYQPGVIDLSERLMPYITGCDSLTISLSSSTPSDFIPKVGDKLVTTEMNDIFPIGFAGEVTAVKGAEIICKGVLLEEVFEAYYNVASVYGYVEEEQSLARGLGTRLNSIDGKWEKDFKLDVKPISYDREISRAVKPNSDLALKGGTSFSVELKPTVHVHVMLIINKEEGTYFQASVNGNLNVKENFSIYGGLDLSHDIPFKMFRIEKSVCPYVNFFVEPGLFISANALISASVEASQDYTFAWARDWSSKGRNIIKPTAGGRRAGSSLDIEGCIDGSIAAGGYVDIGLALIHSALDNISLRGELGAEFVGHAMLYNDDIENAEKGTEVYEKFKQSSFELNAFVNTSCNLQLASGLWGASIPLPWKISHNIKTWDVVPTFSDMKFKQRSDDKTEVDASTSVSGKCLFPVQIGFSVHDDNDEEAGSFWDSSSFRNTRRLMSKTFSGLSSTGEYTLFPRVKAFGIEMLASPSKKLEKAKIPVNITEFKKTKSEYNPNGFGYNDSYYNYKYSCSVTVSLTNSDNVEDWGYVYEDLGGNTTLISLKNYSSPYTDSRYVYYRNESSSYVRLYEYVKYKDDSEYYYGEAIDYPVGYGETSCPDHNHPHMIDLGLPSGTKWACCNVGANVPEDYGNYYAWGETQPKSVYDWDTYKYGRIFSDVDDIGSDISGTAFDAATINWGAPWKMPSKELQIELIDNTKSEWTTVNGVNGRIFTGTNGGSIFIPAAGSRWNSNLHDAGSVGYYWASSLGGYGPICYASGLNLSNISVGWSGYEHRDGGYTIRPVCK